MKRASDKTSTRVLCQWRGMSCQTHVSCSRTALVTRRRRIHRSSPLTSAITHDNVSRFLPGDPASLGCWCWRWSRCGCGWYSRRSADQSPTSQPTAAAEHTDDVPRAVAASVDGRWRSSTSCDWLAVTSSDVTSSPLLSHGIQQLLSNSQGSARSSTLQPSCSRHRVLQCEALPAPAAGLWLGSCCAPLSPYPACLGGTGTLRRPSWSSDLLRSSRHQLSISCCWITSRDTCLSSSRDGGVGRDWIVIGRLVSTVRRDGDGTSRQLCVTQKRHSLLVNTVVYSCSGLSEKAMPAMEQYKSCKNDISRYCDRIRTPLISQQYYFYNYYGSVVNEHI